MNNNEREIHYLDVENLTIDELMTELSRRAIEGLILKCTNDRRIDLGSLCYRSRLYKVRKLPKKVQITSLLPKRVALIKSWCIEYLPKSKLETTGSTLFANADEFASFANWCDDGNHGDFQESDFQYKRALDAYTQHLIISMNTINGVQSLRANRLQAAAIKNGTIFFPYTKINFLNDLPIISHSAIDKGAEKTPTPSKQEMADYLASCHYVFDGLSDFVLKGIPFPHRIPFRDTEILLLPSEFPLSTSSIIDGNVKAQASLAWDYRTGNALSLEEINAKAGCKSGHNRRVAAKTKEILEQANLDSHHMKRHWIAQIAHNAFVPLFVANTAMNESPLKKLLWSEKYEIANSETAGFVTVKFRAGNMEQFFEVKKSFIKHFEKFMKLRQYLCGNETRKFLFLAFKRGELLEVPIRNAPIIEFNKKIEFFIAPDFYGLSHRQLRKYKSTYLLSKNYSVNIVSSVMQNSSQTILKHYTEAEEKVAIDEISATLNFITSVLNRESKIETPGGGCSGEKSSESEVPPDQYEPNCRNFVGCIYCTEFRLHADEDSIRKLLSMRFVTAERLTSCSDIDQFYTLHGNTLKRLDSLITDLIKIKPEFEPIIDRIRNEIEKDYKLHPYWESLYSRLLKLKVIK
jgi:hypothetical protein